MRMQLQFAAAGAGGAGAGGGAVATGAAGGSVYACVYMKMKLQFAPDWPVRCEFNFIFIFDDVKQAALVKL